jgi:hypothetical protein
MQVDHFDWDDEDDPRGNTRHITSAGFDPMDIEDAILEHTGPIELTRRTRRPFIRATTPDGEEIIVVFEIDADDEVVVVRPITAYPRED